MIDHVDTFLAFEDNINHKLLRDIKNTLDNIRPSFFAIKHAKEIMERCVHLTSDRNSLLFSEHQNCIELEAKIRADIDWADYCNKNDTLAFTLLEEACSMDRRIYELELKQVRVLELIRAFPDLVQLPKMVEGMIDQLNVDGLLNL